MFTCRFHVHLTTIGQSDYQFALESVRLAGNIVRLSKCFTLCYFVLRESDVGSFALTNCHNYMCTFWLIQYTYAFRFVNKETHEYAQPW